MNLLQHGTYARIILRREPNSRLTLLYWSAVTARLWGLICFALEMSVTSVLLVPDKWCHDGAGACVNTGLAPRAHLLGEVQGCCCPGVRTGHGQPDPVHSPCLCRPSLPETPERRKGLRVWWKQQPQMSRGQTSLQVRGGRQQFPFHLQQLGGWTHLHLLRPVLFVHDKFLLFI